MIKPVEEGALRNHHGTTLCGSWSLPLGVGLYWGGRLALPKAAVMHSDCGDGNPTGPELRPVLQSLPEVPQVSPGLGGQADRRRILQGGLGEVKGISEEIWSHVGRVRDRERGEAQYGGRFLGGKQLPRVSVVQDVETNPPSPHAPPGQLIVQGGHK